MLEKPKAILFDWDNTIVDTWPHIHNALNDTLAYMGLELWSLEQTKLNVHLSMRDSFKQVFGERANEAAKLYQSRYMTYQEQYALSILPGAIELIDFLSSNPEIYIAVVSNKLGVTLRSEAAMLNLHNKFKKFVGSQDALEDKPSSLPVKLALEGSSIDLGKHVWFVGDTIADMACAYNSGCSAIFYGDDDPTSERYVNYKPHKYFKTHHEFLSALKAF
jgi:phosphoglycolate phosphatase